jgi:hypothetical protein
MRQRVILVSGAELAAILLLKGQQVSGKLYPPRVAEIADRFPVGSYIIVLTPALEGREVDAASGSPYPASTGLSSVFDISADSLSVSPRAILPKASLSIVPPAFLPHYTTDPADPATVRYTPAARTRLTADPRGRLVICMWRGVGKHSIMVPQKDILWLESLFFSLPEYEHLRPRAGAAKVPPAAAPAAEASDVAGSPPGAQPS